MTLDKQQQKAVDAMGPETIAIAGPGSGKTRVLVQRVQKILAGNSNPAAVVVISYTNAAADEIKERLGPVAKSLGYCGTLHGWMLRGLQRFGPAIGLPETIGVIDEDTAAKILSQVQDELRHKGTKKDLDAALERTEELFGKPDLAGAELVAVRYRERLILEGVLDYDSILTCGLRLITKMQGEFMAAEHLLVDEVQDSGDVDAKIYAAAEFAHKFFVGDPDQSIYRFRKANPENLLRMADSAVRHPGGVIWLETSYRSDMNIAAAANKLISHNPRGVKKNIKPVSTAAGVVKAANCTTEIAMASCITTALTRDGAKIEAAAVLCRYNWHAEFIVAGLKALGVPVKSPEQFRAPEDWKLAIRCVAWLANPENNFLAYEALRYSIDIVELNRVRKVASDELTSINRLTHSLENVEPMSAPAWLSRLGIRAPSLEAVNKVLEKAQPRNMAALGLAMVTGEGLHDLKSGAEKGVYVGTIHSAKGQEWEEVYLPWWNQEIFPGGKGQKDPEDLYEERRLAFVALTRAKHRVLILTSATARAYAKAFKPVPMTPSQFIAEARP